MEFALVGVMHIFTGALVKAGVSIFAISTWSVPRAPALILVSCLFMLTPPSATLLLSFAIIRDTDYILVKSENTQHATAALRADGWTVLQGAELGEELPTEVGQAM